MKKISVIIPTYNRKDLLKESMESVLSQSYPIQELVIVDDGSTDQTGEMIHGMQDERIRYIRTEQNLGAAGARNLGIREVSDEADYVAFQDSDDKWLPGKLEKQVKAFERMPEAGFCYHRIGYRLNEGVWKTVPDYEVPVEKMSGDIYAQLLYENLAGCPTLLIRKEILDQTGGFDENLKAWEDYDLVLRLAKITRAAFLDEVLMEARLSEGGVSDNAGNYLMACCMVLRKYREDYLSTGHFNHRVELILRDANQFGMQEQMVALLEKLLST